MDRIEYNQQCNYRDLGRLLYIEGVTICSHIALRQSFLLTGIYGSMIYESSVRVLVGSKDTRASTAGV
jgi:hypothetical protein